MAKKIAGTYVITIGNTAYVGSSSNLASRKHQHGGDLKRNAHPNQNLQAAFNSGKPYSFIRKQIVDIDDFDDNTSLRNHLRQLEQVLLNDLVASGLFSIANVSMNTRGPEARPDMIKRWQDPEFRAKMKDARLKYSPTPETRKKMADQKRGAKNVKSRAIIATSITGETHRFDSTSAAATFFNVSQQVMQQLMAGKISWPGNGPRKCRPQNKWMSQWSAMFA